MSDWIRLLCLAEGQSKTDSPKLQSLVPSAKKAEVGCVDCPNADKGQDSWLNTDYGGCLGGLSGRTKQAAGKRKVEEVKAKEKLVEISSSCYTISFRNKCQHTDA